MSTSVFTERNYAGSTAPYLSPDGYRVELAGLTIMAMPAGHVDIDIHAETSIINVSPTGAAQVHTMKLNGEKVALSTNSANGIAFYGGGSDICLKCENLHWEVLSIGRYSWNTTGER